MHDIDSSVRMLKLVIELMEKKANNILREYDVTVAQVRVLHALKNEPEHRLTFKEVEKRIAVAQSTCVGIVGRLSDKKLVKCSVDRNDHRVKIVKLTEAGEEMLESVSETVRAFTGCCFDGFSEEELVQFDSFINRIAENLK